MLTSLTEIHALKSLTCLLPHNMLLHPIFLLILKTLSLPSQVGIGQRFVMPDLEVLELEKSVQSIRISLA